VPPRLTPTERPRFVRSYYELWGLLLATEPEWDAKISAMRLKHLYSLREMCKINGSGPEEIDLRATPNSQYTYFVPVSRETSDPLTDDAGFATSHRREILLRRITSWIRILYQKEHGRFPWNVWWMGQVDEDSGVIWDHWYDELQIIVCGRDPRRSGARLDLWEDSDDEDVL
jgi:hypothetical protein